MADEILITIKTVLDKRTITQTGEEAKLSLTNALNDPQVSAKAQEAGRKIGNALSLGIETGRNRSSAEQKELAHMRRLESIAAQNAAAIQAIEARKQAQLTLVRERAAQRAIENEQKIQREMLRTSNALEVTRAGIGKLTAALGVLGGAIAFKQIAELGFDLDKSRNSLTALTGSVGAANAKLAELRELAKASPGVTNTFAAQLFSQLKAIGNIGDETINRVIKSLGKLNTVFGDVGPDFARNLVQTFTQSFERADIKEALGRVPIFQQLLKSAFGTDDPEKLRALQKSGALTLGGYLDGLARAVATDPRLANIGETLQGKFQKQFDETRQKLAELGERVLQDLLPILDKLLPPINALLGVFEKLPTGAQAAGIGIIAFSGTLATLTQSIIALNAAGSTGLIARLLSGPVLLTAALVGTTAVQTFREATGNQEMIDRIGGPNQDQIAAILKQRGQSGAEAFRAVAEELRNQRLIAGLPKPELTQPLSGAQAFQLFGTRPEQQAAAAVGAVSRVRDFEADRIARDIAGVKQQILKAQDEFGQGLVEDLQRLSNTLNQQNLDVSKDAAARERLIIEGRQTRQRLTAEADKRTVEELQRTSRRAFNRSGDFIGDAVARGQLTPGEAELAQQAASRELAKNLRDVLAIKERTQGIDQATLDDLRDQIALQDQLGTSISNTERFARGFNSAIGTVGDAFDRFGQNVSRAFGNVKDLFNSLKSAVLGFFNDLLGQSLQNLVRQTLGGLFGSIRGSFSGANGNLFRTPAFAGNAGGNAFQSIVSSLAGAAGGGITAPSSISLPNAIATGADKFGGELPKPNPNLSGALRAAGLGGFGGGGTAAAKFSFAGLRTSLAAAAPFLGLSLGGSLGGQSILGNILGSAGGFLAGGFAAATLAPTLFGPAAAGLLSNPITAIAGAGLLVGSFFLGKAKQRRADEESSGQFLTQALQSINQLKGAIAGDQIDGSQARSIFESQILGTFVQQINTLKTKSVRESRLTNQVRDLRGVFDASILPEIAAQEARKAAGIAKQQQSAANALIFSRQIPEFATGGVVPGLDRGFDSVKALLRPGELVLTQTQQARVIAQAGPSVFQSAGVPGVNQSGRFIDGGIVGGNMAPIEINLQAQVVIGKTDATRIVVVGASTPQGRAVTVKNLNDAKINREF
jgi:hypothetical protein